MFNHFLITRFNLKKADWKTNKNNEAVLTDEWHKNRFQLFTDYCFPTVVSQTNKNFEWLVFFDTSTSEKYRTVIKTLELQLKNFKPIFIDGMDEFLPSVKSYVSNYKEEFLITTTLDNDDCISKFFIDEIQAHFNKQENTSLDFVDGYTLQIHPKVKIGKKLHQYNPFITLIERNETPKTVCNVSHRQWKYQKNVLEIKDKRIWASVIHHENKVNEFTGYDNVDVALFFEDFHISKQKKELVLREIAPIDKWAFESFLNKVSSYFKYYSKKTKKKLGFYK